MKNYGKSLDNWLPKEQLDLFKNRVYLLTAAHCVIHPNYWDSDVETAHTAPNGEKHVFYPELYVALNKKRQPKTKEDWGLFMKLKVNKEHILIPKSYDGKPGCGFDIAIIKVPEKDQ